MTKDDPWASWQAGVKFIRNRLGYSEGKAQKIMGDALASDEVRWRVPSNEGLVGPVRTKPNSITFLRGKNEIGHRGEITKWSEATTFSVADFKYWFNEHHSAARKPKKGGALSKLHFETYLDLFRLEVKKRGWPERENPKGWRTKADVGRWVLSAAEDRKDPSISETTLKDFVGRLMAAREGGN